MLLRVHPLPLAERLIRYDTSTVDGLRSAAGFVKGWLEARDIDVREKDHNGLPVILADVGATAGPSVIFHGHYDVVPGRPEQFEPQVDDDRLIGRGAYDMKGGLAAMLCAVHDVAAQTDVRVRFVCVPDEESEEVEDRSTDALVEGGYSADFAITGEPTDLHIGGQAKGVLAMRLQIGTIEAVRRGGVLDQDEGAVVRHLQVALALREAHDVALGLVEAQLGGVEHGQQRLVVGEDPQTRASARDHPWLHKPTLRKPINPGPRLSKRADSPVRDFGPPQVSLSTIRTWRSLLSLRWTSGSLPSASSPMTRRTSKACAPPQASSRAGWRRARSPSPTTSSTTASH